MTDHGRAGDLGWLAAQPAGRPATCLAWRILSYPLRNVRGVQLDLLLARVRRGDSTNVSFDDLVRLGQALDFLEVGGWGSHRVFAHPNVPELVNLQVERGQAKRYQLRQGAARHAGTVCRWRRSDES
jgi:hypothetical protein